MTIHRVEFPPRHKCTLSLPMNAKLLHVAWWEDAMSLWYECNPGASDELRDFRIVGTGQTIDFTGEYIGTVLIPEKALVFHVYTEVIP